MGIRCPWRIKGQAYPLGNDITNDHSNYRGTKGRDKWDKSTAPTGSFDANGYGLYDMAGNAWEWCADWYDENYYANSPLKNPLGPDTVIPKYRVWRGGSWSNNTSRLRVANRDLSNPAAAYDDVSFRCVPGSK